MGSSSSVAAGGEKSGGGGGGGDSKPPTLYIHPFSAPCRAVLMTAAAAGIKLNIKKLDMLKGEHKSKEFLKINPDHTVPTLVDGSLKLWESRAIMQYLLNKYGGGKSSLYPADPVQRAPVDRILQYDLGVAYKNISAYVYPQIFAQQDPDAEKKEEVEKTLDYLENILKKQTYLTGSHLTIADLSMTSGLSLLDVVSWEFGERWSAVAIWRENIKKETWYEAANKGVARFLEVGLEL